MTTQTLAINAQNGNKQAFTALFDRLYTTAYRRAMKRLHCHEDAEDATSQAFVKAWQCLSSWKPERNTFEKWFFTIVHNTVIDTWRVRERYRQKHTYYAETLDTDGYGALNLIPDTHYTPLDALIVSEGVLQIETALAEIPTEHRNHRLAWVLRHFEGYSYKEIVRILQKPETTCKIWVHRCNKYLKRELQDSRESGRLT